MSFGRDEYVTVTAFLKARTDKAVLLELSGDGEGGWIPRSCLHFQSDRLCQEWPLGDEVEVRVMEWVAEKRGLI